MTRGVMITGGTGAFGRAFARYLLDKMPEFGRIVIYSRNEFNQHLMAEEFGNDDRLRFMIGDVRDRDRLRRAMYGIKFVVHAAALKRIEVGHYNPIEMVKTNVLGSINVIEAAMDASVDKVILLSSDKAFQPVSPYGLSKATAEFLFLEANNMRGWHGPMFSVCRYGNVWGSTGSVGPLWKKRRQEGLTIVPVTDPDCTRFFMKMEEAIELVLQTFNTMKGGEINVPDLPAYRLEDLAFAMGMVMDIKGLPKWEKKHESMDEHHKSNLARRMSNDELKDAIDKI